MKAQRMNTGDEGPSVSESSVVLGTTVVLLGAFFLVTAVVAGPPDRIVSSIAILVVLAGVGWCFGYVSVPMMVACVCYVPALSFFWAWANGGRYINFLNPWLQDDLDFVNRAVFLCLISLLVTAGLLVMNRRRLTFSQLSLSRPVVRLSPAFFALATLAAGGLFWLTDPGPTLLTASYVEVLEGRFAGTQFAGNLGLLAWLTAFATYLALDRRGIGRRRGYSAARYLFWGVTVLSMLWLFLHSRRSELAGMLLVMMLVMAEKKGARRAALILAAAAAALVVNERVRSVAVVDILEDEVELSSLLQGSPEVVSLPGGASQIMMSFVDVVHYYGDTPFLYGETFSNYAFQLLPTSVYATLGVEKKPHFFETGVYDDYAWNGGTYAIGVFYANFGVLGCLGFGVVVAAYIIVCGVCLRHRNLAIRAIGLYMIAIVFRAFWYELITFIKPALFVLAVSLLFRSPGGSRADSIARAAGEPGRP